DSIYDMYESTVELLKEVLHQETDFSGFTESVTISEKIQSDLIKCGALDYAADLLAFIKELEERVRSSMPQWSDRLKEATLTAGTRERLQFLAQALNEQPEIESKKIIIYLKNLGWESLGGVTDLLGDVEHREHREAVCCYLSEEGKTKVDLISRGVFDKRWFVVRNAAAILARIGDDRALSYLLKIVNHDEKRVRLSIVENLTGCANIKALEILSKTVMDQDAEVREKSVQSIIAFKGPEAFDVIEDIIQSERFINFDANDKKLMLEAYSILGSDQAVSTLNVMVLRFNYYRNSAIEAQREAAIGALAINQSEKAEKALLSLASSWRLNIRSLATSALHKRRAVMYGADNADGH
ncbi:MAG: HEAT repeat domain-containing protein, partial [Candidatus Zixiibacteriota bacterium]